jgi:hypothetical protein
VPAVSVPCPSCRAPILIGQRVCSACERAVERALLDALLERFEAADEDYRDAREQARRASIVMLVVALFQIAIGGVWFVLDQTAGESAAPTTLGAVAFIRPLVVGAALLGCFVWTIRAPVAGLGVGLALWLGVELLVIGLAPALLLISFLSATGVAILLAKIVAVGLLTRGLLAALSARAMLARWTVRGTAV